MVLYEAGREARLVGELAVSLDLGLDPRGDHRAMAAFGFVRKRGLSLDVAAVMQMAETALHAALPFSPISPGQDAVCVVICDGTDYVGATDIGLGTRSLRGAGFAAIGDPPSILEELGLDSADVREAERIVASIIGSAPSASPPPMRTARGGGA